jgi:hypothetical protein
VRHALRIQALNRFLVASRSSHVSSILWLLLPTAAPARALLRLTSRSLALLAVLRSRLPGLALLSLFALPLLLPVVEAFDWRRGRIAALLPNQLLFDLGQLLA